MKSNAKLFCDTTEYPANLPVLDLSKPDPELFEDALHEMAMQWSSSNGAPHFKESMRRAGRVGRNSKGHVFIMGAGWNVSIYTDEFIKNHQEILARKDYQALAELTTFDSCWVA